MCCSSMFIRGMSFHLYVFDIKHVLLHKLFYISKTTILFEKKIRSSCNYIRKSLDVTDFFLKHKKFTEKQKQKSPNHIVSSIVHISNKFGSGVCFQFESHAGKIAMYESYRFGLLLFIHHNRNNKKRKSEK